MGVNALYWEWKYKPFHSKQQDIQGFFQVLASFISEDMEEVIEYILQDCGPVKVPVASQQYLGLTTVSWISE